MDGQEQSLALPVGAQIGQFRVVSVLGAGGFGIVYKAQHISINKTVAIKEYLPEHLATREGDTVRPFTGQKSLDYKEGLDKFIEEANQLCDFSDHPNIVACNDFIELNGTAYLIMNFYEGRELLDIMNDLQVQGEPLTEFEISETIVPILRGLKYIHEQDVLHRDIKPSNIFIVAKTGQPILIDFGASKKSFSVEDKTTNQARTHGYAPLEQATTLGELGPWTDLHAVGVMMWRIVCVQNPVPVEDRNYLVNQRNEIDPMYETLDLHAQGYHPRFIAIIKKSISLNIRDRYQTADEFIHALETYKTEGLSDGQDTLIGPSTGVGAGVGSATASNSDTRHQNAADKETFSYRTPLIGVIFLVLVFSGYFVYDFISSSAPSLAQSGKINLLMDTFNQRIEIATENVNKMESEIDFIEAIKLICITNPDGKCDPATQAQLDDANRKVEQRKLDKIEWNKQARNQVIDLYNIYLKEPEKTRLLMEEKIASELAANNNAKASKLEIMKELVIKSNEYESREDIIEFIDVYLGKE